MNCLQNLTSRIAGVDNEQMTNRVLGTTAMLGFGLGAIKEQFKTPSMNLSNNNNTPSGSFKGLVNRAKSVINPSMNLSNEKDYNGNINPIRDVIPKQKSNTTIQNFTSNSSRTMNPEDNSYKQKSTFGKVASAGFSATKAFLSAGARMAEGDFNNSNLKYKGNINNRKNKINTFQNTQYVNSISNNNKLDKLGDTDEHKK